VAAALERLGLVVQVEDLYRFGGGPRDVSRLVEESRPRILGVSTLTSGYPLVQRLCRAVKTHAPDIATVVGGVHATALPLEVLADPNVDFVVRGEGELTFGELVTAILENEATSERLGQIAGIGFNDHGSPRLTAERPPLDINAVPEPARHLVPLEQYLQAGALLASRGCPHRCFFCSSVSFSSHRYRFRLPEAILAEMDTLHRDRGLTEFEFLDDVLTADPGRLRALCDSLTGRGYRWGCQATIKEVSADLGLIDTMAAAGCGGVFFGVESGNEAVLRKVKALQIVDVISVVNRARELGLNVITSFMIGHPWDTIETIEDTYRLMVRLRDLGCHTPFSILVPFPGSPLALEPDKFGVTVHPADYSTYYHSRALVTTRALTRAQLEDKYFEILCRLAPSSGTGNPASTSDSEERL
jgi:radical SAM superfamily enzyme YgiQ (UPF0313 family)